MSPRIILTLSVAAAALVLGLAAFRDVAGFGIFKSGMPPAAESVAACPLIGPPELAGDGMVGLPFSTFEGLDGRTVTLPQEFTIAQNHFLGRYGQLTLAVGGRVFHPNNGTCATPYDEVERFIVLDDGSFRQNPDPVPYMGPETLRVGSSVSGLSGRLDLADVYMSAAGLPEWFVLTPDTEITFDPTANPRPAAPPDVGGDVRVAVFNVENYFTSLGVRGARNVREFDRQHTKLVAALAGLEADVVGLIEVENDDGATLQVLLDGVPDGPDGLNGAFGGDWSWVVAPGLNAGSDEIGLAFIYRTSVLEPVGAANADISPLHNRPPVAQEFEHIATGERFTLILAHLKSRGGCQSHDPDQGSGCWDALRTRQADSLLETFSVSVSEGRTLLLGDLNAYALEAPVAALAEAGLDDLLARFVPETERYTYVFSPGWSGYIDHAHATPAMLELVCGAAVWHINSDEPTVYSYSADRFGPDMYSPDPYRSSDHDPLLVGLGLAEGC